MSSNELNFLIEFKNKYLHGNIDELADFSFWDINTNAGEYFSGNGNVQPEEYFDGDRTKIVYTIQYLLLDGSGIPNFSHDATGRQYTGDTINTFNSLFGKTPELRKKIERKFGFSEREKELRNNFYRTYQCIGNFYILPAATVKSGNRIESINTLRGTNEWRDFFDLFLSNLDLIKNFLTHFRASVIFAHCFIWKIICKPILIILIIHLPFRIILLRRVVTNTKRLHSDMLKKRLNS